MSSKPSQKTPDHSADDQKTRDITAPLGAVGSFLSTAGHFLEKGPGLIGTAGKVATVVGDVLTAVWVGGEVGMAARDISEKIHEKIEPPLTTTGVLDR